MISGNFKELDGEATNLDEQRQKLREKKCEIGAIEEREMDDGRPLRLYFE